ncbi:hypothetical protein CDL15_Pgr015466 [Punica granatum]|uniref:Uncharacterized protein n=1 Tax=Punica granatum TaxID=22663 RepID=A0A218W153_PUNGR|nr:hypothetical protein CDL15_Pgr015466 [Punica granatum]
MRLEEEGPWEWRGDGESAGLPSLRERGCNREDNLDRTFEDAIGVTEEELLTFLEGTTQKGIEPLPTTCSTKCLTEYNPKFLSPVVSSLVVQSPVLSSCRWFRLCFSLVVLFPVFGSSILLLLRASKVFDDMLMRSVHLWNSRPLIPACLLPACLIPGSAAERPVGGQIFTSNGGIGSSISNKWCPESSATHLR